MGAPDPFIPWPTPPAGAPEIVDGPRARWLRALEVRFGPKVWEIIQQWPAWKVDRFIEARAMPFNDSKYQMEEEAARRKGRTTYKFEKRDAIAREIQITVRDPGGSARRRHGGGNAAPAA